MDQGTRVASTLRRAREERGLAIEEAAADAGIPLRYARLLEGQAPGSSVGISDELYLVPFFRRYARFLGIVPEEMLADLLGEVEVPGPPAARPSPLVYRSSFAGLWKPLAVVVTVAAAVAIMLRHAPERPVFDDERWTERGGAAPGSAIDADPRAGSEALRADSSGSRENPAAADPAGTAASAAERDLANGTRDGARGVALADDPARHDANGIPRDGAGQRDASEPRDDTLGAEEGGGDAGPEYRTDEAGAHVLAAVGPGLERSLPGQNARELRITAAEETWVSLGIDEEPRKSVLLHPGETRTWIANGTFTLTVGNAGGITIALDGRELPPLGKSGQVVRNLRLPEARSTPTEG